MKDILIDLDGVLNEYTGNYIDNYIPPIKNGAVRFLEKLSEKYNIIIFTTRNTKLAKQWLKDNNCGSFVKKITNTKEPSYLIIDDRCLTFNGNYEDIILQIEKFKPWYK